MERQAFFYSLWTFCVGIVTLAAFYVWYVVRFGQGGEKPDDVLDGSCYHVGSSMLFLGYLALSIFLPLLGFIAGNVDCETGYPYEYHTAMFFYMCLLRLWELFTIWRMRGCMKYEVKLVNFMFKFSIGWLVTLDTYTDTTFITLAHSCESILWIPALILNIVGIWCMQYGGGCLCTILSARRSKDYRFVFPKAAQMDLIHHIAAHEIGNGTDDDYFPSALFGLMRCMCEDLGLMIVQVIFLVQRGGNAFVIMSICIGFAVSAAGTVFNCLKYQQAQA